MRLSIDSNILIYAFENEEPRHRTAYRIMTSAFLGDCVLTNQALGEFLKVCAGRYPSKRAEARQVVEDWAIIYPIAPTATAHLVAASRIAERHRLQFWESLIIAIAGAAGAEVLLTEDMQDGATIAGVRLLNPFGPANAEQLDLLLTPPPGMV